MNNRDFDGAVYITCTSVNLKSIIRLLQIMYMQVMRCS